MEETEIQGQVKKAYLKACESKKVGSSLHYLFQKSLHNGKTLRSANLATKSPSLSSLIALEIQTMQAKNVLVIGNSEIGRGCINSLKRSFANPVFLCTRHPIEMGITLWPWERLKEWSNFDAVIATSRVNQPILLSQKNIKTRKIFDLGVPRCFDPKIKGVKNLDTIQQKYKTDLSKIERGIEKITQIVAQQYIMRV